MKPKSDNRPSPTVIDRGEGLHAFSPLLQAPNHLIIPKSSSSQFQFIGRKPQGSPLCGGPATGLSRDVNTESAAARTASPAIVGISVTPDPIPMSENKMGGLIAAPLTPGPSQSLRARRVCREGKASKQLAGVEAKRCWPNT